MAMGHRLYFDDDQDYYWLNYERASCVSAALESMQLCHAYDHTPSASSKELAAAALRLLLLDSPPTWFRQQRKLAAAALWL